MYVFGFYGIHFEKENKIYVIKDISIVYGAPFAAQKCYIFDT